MMHNNDDKGVFSPSDSAITKIPIHVGESRPVTMATEDQLNQKTQDLRKMVERVSMHHLKFNKNLVENISMIFDKIGENASHTSSDIVKLIKNLNKLESHVDDIVFSNEEMKRIYDEEIARLKMSIKVTIVTNVIIDILAILFIVNFVV